MKFMEVFSKTDNTRGVMEIITLKFKLASEIYTSALNNIKAIIAPTKVQPGCLDCCIYCGVNDNTSLLFVERWDNVEHLHKHIRSEDFKVVLAMMELSQIKPEFSIQTISETKGIDDLTELMSDYKS